MVGPEHPQVLLRERFEEPPGIGGTQPGRSFSSIYYVLNKLQARGPRDALAGHDAWTG
jgi:hypothetical protein